MFEASQLPDLNMFAIEKKYGLCKGIHMGCALLPLSFNREQIEQFTRHEESNEQSVHYIIGLTMLDYTASNLVTSRLFPYSWRSSPLHDCLIQLPKALVTNDSEEQ